MGFNDENRKRSHNLWTTEDLEKQRTGVPRQKRSEREIGDFMSEFLPIGE